MSSLGLVAAQSAGASSQVHSGPGGPVVNGHRCTVWGGATTNDRLVGSHNGDVVCGLGGHDELVAAANDVTLIGGPGNSRLKVLPGTGNGDVLIDHFGNDVFKAGAGTETLDGRGSAGDRMTAGTGNDVLLGGNGFNHLRGGPGRDTLIGGNGGNVLIAGTGPNTLVGGNAHDVLRGNPAGHDVLIGGNGNDTINAEDGQGDEIDGGDGGDTIQGCSPGGDQVSEDDQGASQGDQGENEDGDCQGDNTASLNLGEFDGTISNVAASSIDLQVCEVDDIAQAWITTNNVPGTLCSTMTVAINIDANTQIERDGGLPLQKGDQAEVVADTTNPTLLAIDISAQPTDD
jgi:Ca2+-binding RTX toxin-like protein